MVKYADGPTTQQRLRIDALPDAVWELIADPGFSVAQSSELQEARWDPEGPPTGLGARILGRNHHQAIGDWATTSTIVDWDPPRLMSWAVADPDRPAARWWFEIEPDGNGSIVTQQVRLGPGTSGLTPAIEAMPDREDDIIAKRLAFHQANMAANLEALRATLEGKAKDR